MGCGLRKMKPVSEENSPGKIYSTLRRPQVETKVGVAYTYQYLDFLIGKDGGTSTLRLSSIRELPGQLQELYQQGFVLAAVHPFIHPCSPEAKSPHHQLYRAILVRLNDGVERSLSVCPPCKLQLEDCLSAEQVPTPELIQGYVKKQIQDAADQGVMFVGFVQEPHGALCTRTGEADTPSLSLHSSPSSVLGSLSSCSPSNLSSPRQDAKPAQADMVDRDAKKTREGAPSGEKNYSGCSTKGNEEEVSPTRTSLLLEGDVEQSEELTEEESSHHGNNKDSGTKERPRYLQQRGHGIELMALYNHPLVQEGQVKYYTVKVPLQVQNCDEGVKGVEANWLDHMTQHFNNGASLVDGYFNLGNVNELLPKSVESVFIFQEAGGSEANMSSTTYDAIVVEQWTVIDGLQVKADYVPLLQTLATFGWRLTCVLPTPVINRNSDGSLSTKQIIFLQRPILGRKRRESKKLIFKPRSRSGKNCIKETAKNKKKKKTQAEMDAEDPRILDDRERVSGEEEEKRLNVTMKESEACCREGVKMDDGREISVGRDIKTNGEEEETNNTGGENSTEDRGEEMALDGEGSTVNGEPVDNGEIKDVLETVATVEMQTKEKEDNGTEEGDAVVQNGVEADEERDEGKENRMNKGEPARVEVVSKETLTDLQASNQNSQDTQE